MIVNINLVCLPIFYDLLKCEDFRDWIRDSWSEVFGKLALVKFDEWNGDIYTEASIPDSQAKKDYWLNEIWAL